MDNLTHTLTGVAISRLGIDKRVEGATLTLALACNLPDVDIVSALWGLGAYLEHHRGITHALPASPLMAAGLAFILSAWPKSKRRVLPTFLIAWLGVIVHVLSDLWTSYGTRALLPFDSTWYAWDWIFIVDPALLILLAFACFGARWLGRPSTNRWAAAAALAYIGLRAFVHDQALGQARGFAGSEYPLVRAFPSPLDLNEWRFLARNETSFARGTVQAIGSAREKETIVRQSPDALVTRVATESRAAKVFLSFSIFPKLEVTREGGTTTILWRDLRFSDRRRNGFLCEVKVAENGRILSERIVF